MRDEKSKSAIIILHGWGLKGLVYDGLSEILKKAGYTVYAPDMPGFGAEPLGSVLKLDDYVAFIRKFIEKNNIKKPIVIAHSFGGRVALKYMWQYPSDVAKLVLTGVPIIRHTSFKKQAAYIAAVTGGIVFFLFPQKEKDLFRKILYKSIGEWDYYKSGNLKEVFKNIIAEDLIPYAKVIKIPTSLVWGKDDRLVPSSDIEKIKEYIPQATSVIVPNIGHRLPVLMPKEFFTSIQSFL